MGTCAQSFLLPDLLPGILCVQALHLKEQRLNVRNYRVSTFLLLFIPLSWLKGHDILTS